MKNIEYIGPKQDGERHLRDQTGIEWFPGDVKAVSDQHAEEFLRHPTSWREAAGKPAALAKVAPAPAVSTASDSSAVIGAGLPGWVKKGIELGATDDQLEAIAQAGGPESEEGAALWQDATGQAWTSASTTQAPAVKKAKAPAKKAPAKKKPAAKRAKKAAE